LTGRDCIIDFHSIIDRRRKKNIPKFGKEIKWFYDNTKNENTRKFVLDGRKFNFSKMVLNKMYTNNNTKDLYAPKELLFFNYNYERLGFKISDSYIKYFSVLIFEGCYFFYFISKYQKVHNLTIYKFYNKDKYEIITESSDKNFERCLIKNMMPLIESLMIYEDSCILHSSLTSLSLEEFLVSVLNDIVFDLN
jgi:hypothetical protein